MSYLQMIGITKRFPGVLANDGVDLDLYKGEVHGLLGENGAGKTTLMNILFGLYQPDAGQILIEGKPVALASPADAIRCGIGMVHQHFRLVPPFTVTENIILGLNDGALIDMKAAERKVAEVAAQYGLKVNPSAKVQQLSVGEQQRVEILSSLYRGAEVLILDEPTAVLTPQEADSLAEVLKKMAQQGKAIVFISHKLEEVLKLTDRVTVLRAGRVVFKSMTKDTTKAEMASEMIGRDFTTLRTEQQDHILALAGAQESKLAGSPAQVIKDPQKLLEVEDLYTDDDRGLPAVRGITFDVSSGEILGVAGVDGNGQRELSETIGRLRPVRSGGVRILGKDASGWNPGTFVNHHAAYISEDRQNEGLILEFDLSTNSVLKLFQHEPFSQKGLLKNAEIDGFTERLMQDFDVRAPGPHVHAGTLSGGNQQKLVLARELSQAPSLIIANKPTRGLDIGAAAYIHKKLLAERARGAGILLFSADLDEILMMSDRVLVMFNGQSMGILDAHSADTQTLGLMMAGTSLERLKTKEVAE